jgi:hypothetical protein
LDRPTFLRIAREMRALQKEFFATRPEHRPPDLITRARAAEKRFDEALERFSTNQRSLFHREERD